MVALTLVFLLLFNFIALKCPDPEPLIGIFAWAIPALAGIGGGIAAVLFERERVYFCAAVSGAIYAAIYLIACAAAGGDMLTVVMRVAAAFACALLFAAICRPRKAPAGKKLKEYRKYTKKQK